MGDGSDGAGGVGNDGGSNGTGNDTSATDSVSGLSEAAADMAAELAGAISSALGLDSNAISDALSGLADMLGLDAQDLQGLVGAALLGAVTGGLPGAMMGVVNALAGGSLTDAARDAVSKNVPESLQPFANLAIDAFSGSIPGAGISVEGALSSLASGALTNGRAPDIADIGAVARSLTDVRSLASDVLSGLDLSSPDAAAASVERALGSHFAEARSIAQGVVDGYATHGSAYASGGHGDFGNAVEALAIDVVRALGNR